MHLPRKRTTTGLDSEFLPEKGRYLCQQLPTPRDKMRYSPACPLRKATSSLRYDPQAGFPPAPAIIDLAKALQITTDELLGVKAPKVERIDDGPETRRLWKRFQMVSTLPEKDQKAVIRLINSLVSVGGHSRTVRQAG